MWTGSAGVSQQGNACSWSVWDSHSSAVSTRWKVFAKGYLQPLCAALSGCSGRWGYFLSLSAPFIVDKKFLDSDGK